MPVAVPPLWAEVQPTGELTHDQNVDAGESVRTDRRRGHEGGLHRDRSKIRVQLEPFPKPEQSHSWSLDRIGIIPLRPTDGTEQTVSDDLAMANVSTGRAKARGSR